MRPIIEYEAACWDPFRQGHIKGLDRVKKRGKMCMSDVRFELRNVGEG